MNIPCVPGFESFVPGFESWYKFMCTRIRILVQIHAYQDSSHVYQDSNPGTHEFVPIPTQIRFSGYGKLSRGGVCPQVLLTEPAFSKVYYSTFEHSQARSNDTGYVSSMQKLLLRRRIKRKLDNVAIRDTPSECGVSLTLRVQVTSHDYGT